MNWNNVSLIVLGLAAFFGAFFVALWASLVIWTFRDMRARTRDAFAQFLAALMVLVLGPFGIILYFILRPRETLSEKFERSLEEEALLQDIEERQICPGCKQPIQPDYVLCPICHTHLRAPCIHCGRLIHPRWSLCPYCAQGQEPIPGLDRAGRVTLQDLGAEPGTPITAPAAANRTQEPAFVLDEPRAHSLPSSAFDHLEPEAEELPEEMMAELQKEADEAMSGATRVRAAEQEDEAKRTRQLRIPPNDPTTPPQSPEPEATEPTTDPENSNPETGTRQPLSLFRRR
jgi:RNA polymerase subunit RPABC4/transcription elongation factor Spt4